MEPIYELGSLSIQAVKSAVRLTSVTTDVYAVGNPLSKLFNEYSGVNYGMNVRTPLWHKLSVDFNGNIADAEYWHQDGTRDNRPKWMLIWTNLAPTHVQLPDETETTIRPNILTLIDNRTCRHRAPYLSNWHASRRWFLRQHLLLDGLDHGKFDLDEKLIAKAQKRLTKFTSSL